VRRDRHRPRSPTTASPGLGRLTPSALPPPELVAVACGGGEEEVEGEALESKSVLVYSSKSTTLRSLYDASSTDQPHCSRSVSAHRVEDEYTNTLFDSKASPSTSSSMLPPATATSSGGGDVVRRGQDRGCEPAKARGRGGGRARSVSTPSAGSVGDRQRAPEVSPCFTSHH
jgi:hypothetical protein